MGGGPFCSADYGRKIHFFCQDIGNICSFRIISGYRQAAFSFIIPVCLSVASGDAVHEHFYNFISFLGEDTVRCDEFCQKNYAFCQNQQNQDQNGGQDKKEQPQGQQPKISPQAAQQMLQAIQAKEKETQDKVNKQKAEALKSRQKEKNW